MTQSASMIFRLLRKNTATEAVYAVYSAIVAQSRQPVFYAEWGVPDTVTGRFDVICVHLSLLFRRLRSEQKQVREFSQALFDLFFKDMDRSLRELGVGDLAVPKRIQKMGSAFYGLMTALSEALDAADAAEVEAVLARNLFPDAASGVASQLADYVIAEAARLERQPLDDILAGRLAPGAAA